MPSVRNLPSASTQKQGIEKPVSPTDYGQAQVLTVDAENDALPDFTLTLQVRTGTTFTADGADLVSPLVDGISYRIEGGTDLTDFNSPVNEVIPHLGSRSTKPGYILKTFCLTNANGLPNKGFLRASAE